MSAAKGFDALTREQQKQMLEWFMYRIKPEQREDLAGSLPAAYNAWCGSEILKVVSVKDPERVWRTTRTESVDGKFVRVRVGEPQRQDTQCSKIEHATGETERSTS